MRTLPAFVAIASLSLGLGGCGGERRSAPSPTRDRASGDRTSRSDTQPASKPSAYPLDSDADNDNPTHSRYDRDDQVVLDFGHAAGATDRRAIEGLVRRYYAAAAAGDGAAGCASIYSTLAESVPEEYGHLADRPDLRGNTCAVVMDKLFRQRHPQLASDAVALKVTLVRVKGPDGLAFVRFAGTHERRVTVQRERGVWKMGALLDAGVP